MYAIHLGAAKRARRGVKGAREVQVGPAVVDLGPVAPTFTVERGGQVLVRTLNAAEAKAVAAQASTGGETTIKAGPTVLALYKDGKAVFAALSGCNAGLCQFGETVSMDVPERLAATRAMREVMRRPEIRQLFEQLRARIAELPSLKSE